MRSLLLGLLLINILFWVWAAYVAQPSQKPQNIYNPNELPSLEIVESSSLENIIETEQPENIAAVVNGAGTTDVIDIDGESSSDPLSDIPITVAPEDDQKITLSTQVEFSPTVSLPDGSKLLAEADPIEFPAACFTVGPFVGLDQSNRAATALASVGVTVRERAEEAEVWVGHWVHLPAYPNRAAAVAEVERLRNEGVEDIYIEPSGELANTVSLGLFSDLTRAEIRAGKLRKLDVRPQIADRHREGLVYWVDMSLDAGFTLNLEAFEKVPNQQISSTKADCELILVEGN